MLSAQTPRGSCLQGAVHMGTGAVGSLALSTDRGADLVLISSVHEGLHHFVLQRVGDTVALYCTSTSTSWHSVGLPMGVGLAGLLH